MHYLAEVLHVTQHDLRRGLLAMRQGTHGARDFANRFEQVARAAGLGMEEAKVDLLAALNDETKRLLESRLGAHLQLRLGLSAMAVMTPSQYLDYVTMQELISMLQVSQTLGSGVATDLGASAAAKPRRKRNPTQQAVDLVN